MTRAFLIIIIKNTHCTTYVLHDEAKSTYAGEQGDCRMSKYDALWAYIRENGHPRACLPTKYRSHGFAEVYFIPSRRSDATARRRILKNTPRLAPAIVSLYPPNGRKQGALTGRGQKADVRAAVDKRRILCDDSAIKAEAEGRLREGGEAMRRPSLADSKAYWLCAAALVALSVLMFVLIFWMNSLTGERELWAFERADWYYFGGFLLAEALIVFALFRVALCANAIERAQRLKREALVRAHARAGFAPDDAAMVWLDAECARRAVIRAQDEGFRLAVEAFDFQTDQWRSLSGETPPYPTLEAVRTVLDEEYDFYCDEDTV